MIAPALTARASIRSANRNIAREASRRARVYAAAARRMFREEDFDAAVVMLAAAFRSRRTARAHRAIARGR
ncbi:hypothetical protein [Sandaracinus amylolyticus]|uniref:hypothetical protein n=1 Tax=Sandaracinus amylolyticus TaxID=927083 RepID=UPI001F2CF9F0|nr:hypothetical protein [Sandaracinus amylolyticus]UJR81449.1 Hypothetical protein I5071_35080 [Sandaracinus amylolyticus]